MLCLVRLRLTSNRLQGVAVYFFDNTEQLLRLTQRLLQLSVFVRSNFYALLFLKIALQSGRQL